MVGNRRVIIYTCSMDVLFCFYQQPLDTARLLQQESNPNTSAQVSFLFPIILVMFSFFNAVSHKANY